MLFLQLNMERDDIQMLDSFNFDWHLFEDHVKDMMKELWSSDKYADITLISDDKVKFSAHKILLTSCSKLFKFILEGNFHTNPLLYLSGVSSVNLGFILDYIYHGEVNLFQEQLDSFLESAQKLEIEGLLGVNTNKQEQEQDTLWRNNKINAFQEQDINNIKESMDEDKILASVVENEIKPRHYNRGVSSSTQVANVDVGSMSTEEVEMKKNELFQKVNDVWSCLSCPYTSSRSFNIKKHVETHLDGLCYTCTLCSKEFRSKGS